MSSDRRTERRQRPPRNVVRWVKIGGHEYPMTTKTSCLVCTAAPSVRKQIERALLMGYRYAKVASSVEPLAEHLDVPMPTVESIQHHVTGQHMPVPQQMQRELIEERADRLGKDIQDGDGSLADYVAVNETIIQKGLDRMTSGELQPTMAELLQALKLQAQIEAKTSGTGSITTEAYQEALMEYLRLARQYMPPEVWQSFGRALADSPILKALAERYDRQQHELP